MSFESQKLVGLRCYGLEVAIAAETKLLLELEKFRRMHSLKSQISRFRN